MRLRPAQLAPVSPLSSDAALADVVVLLADSLRPGYDVVDTLDLLVGASTTFTSAVEAGFSWSTQMTTCTWGRLPLSVRATARRLGWE